MVEWLGREKASEGLIGLIALGSAFESIDVIMLLGSVDENSASLNGLAKKRAEHLAASGRKPIMSPTYLESLDTAGSMLRDTEWVQKAWLELNREGERYRKNRTDFMLTKLKSGKHPDTDPDFWQGYIETPKTDLSKYEPSRAPKQPSRYTWPIFGLATITLAGMAILIFKRLRTRPLF